MKHFAKRAQKGVAIVQMIALIFMSFLLGAFAVDFGFHVAVQNQMRTAADAAALAAVSKLFTSTAASPQERQEEAIEAAMSLSDKNAGFITPLFEDDVYFGFIDPGTRTYNAASFLSPSEDPNYEDLDGYNAVYVNVSADQEHSSPLPTIMARLLGQNTMETHAGAAAILDNTIGSMHGGLRPVYACYGQYQQAMADNNPHNNVARIYGKQFYLDGNTDIEGCPPPGAGNWGFADLTDADPGAPGAHDISEWFRNGFPHNVAADQYYSTQPGNFLSNSPVQSALNGLISNETVIMLPLISDDYTGDGSNTQVRVVGFTGFVVTDYRGNGPADSRYIEGYFTRAICRDSQCRPGTGNNLVGGGVANLRLVH
jgi:hypothetical protein